jgi:hypothetical protein
MSALLIPGIARLLLVLSAVVPSLPQAALASSAGVLLALPGAFQSPWWENYSVRQSFLCPQRGLVVVERNDSQASLLTGGLRFTLFRESSDGPGLQFRNEDLRLILRGDELTLETLPQRRLTCQRTEDA